MPAPKRVRVAILEPDLHYRLFLEAHLSANPRYLAVQCAASLDETRAWSDELQPDILLVEIASLRDHGSHAITELLTRFPAALPIVLTEKDAGLAVLSTVRSGAVGYILKQAGKAEIFEALDQALSGGSPVSPRVARDLFRILASESSASANEPPRIIALPDPAPLPKLSPREQKILSLVTSGASDKAIGEQLGLARSTVKNALLGIFGKWQVRTRTEAAVKFSQQRAPLIADGQMS